MRPAQSFTMSFAVICAANGAIGCTVYSAPPRVRASVGVGVRAERQQQPQQSRPRRQVTVATPPIGSEEFALFHTALAPYGEWLDAPVCGAHRGRVWRPYTAVVGPEFVPYGNGGRWVATDHGWVFDTDWEWGWAPFHYGRWCNDQRLGWTWVPGTEWGSAWVDWRFGGGFVGWVPLPPAGVPIREEDWVFVDTPTFTGRRITHVALPPERQIEARRVARPHRSLVFSGSYSWPAGPPVIEVQAASGATIRPVTIAPPAPGKVRRVVVRHH